MKSGSRGFLLIGSALFILLLFTTTGHAGDPNGVWTSSTGSKINLWANMQQVNVTVTTPQGQVYKYNGQWTRFSDYFVYQTHLGLHQASFVNSNMIRVQDPSGKVFNWTRGYNAQQQQMQQMPQQPSANMGISGNWRSTSGSMVQLSSQGNQISVTIISPNGARSDGIGRWIQYGSKFDYSIAGFNGVANCTVASPNRIDVLFGGKWTTWTR